jgi:hypothetical protein
MSVWLVGLIGIVYLYIGFEQFLHGKTGTGIMFMGYALANVGLILEVK